jgi:hypothetical protein
MPTSKCVYVDLIMNRYPFVSSDILSNSIRLAEALITVKPKEEP